MRRSRETVSRRLLMLIPTADLNSMGEVEHEAHLALIRQTAKDLYSGVEPKRNEYDYSALEDRISLRDYASGLGELARMMRYMGPPIKLEKIWFDEAHIITGKELRYAERTHESEKIGEGKNPFAKGHITRHQR